MKWLSHHTKNGVEHVKRDNCYTTGDLLCDTPADPSPAGASDANCNYTGTPEKDINGDYYTPEIANIMSYYPSACVSKLFTTEQYRRIAKCYIDSRNKLK